MDCLCTCCAMAVFASVVTHDAAGVDVSGVLHCVLCFVRPTAVWTGGHKQYKSLMSVKS